MRITFVLPGYAEMPSGGFKVVYEYANFLAERGHSISIIHPRGLFRSGPSVSWHRRAKREITAVWRSLRRGIRCFKIRVNWMELSREIDVLSVPLLHSSYVPDADIIVATQWRTAEIVSKLPSSKGVGCYLIQHYETWDGPQHRVDETFRTGLHKLCIARWLEKISLRFDPVKTYYAPNSIDSTTFRVMVEAGSRETAVCMMYSQQIWKGSEDGVTALTKLRDRYPNLTAKFFGTCQRPVDLPDWITYYRNPPIDILVREIYNDSDIYLCTSWSEGWGLPVTEAMACGCAVVTTANGGIDDIIDNGVSGIIEPVKMPDRLAEACEKLIRDESLRRKISLNGLEKVKRFTYEKTIPKIEEIFYEVIPKGKSVDLPFEVSDS